MDEDILHLQYNSIFNIFFNKSPLNGARGQPGVSDRWPKLTETAMEHNDGGIYMEIGYNSWQ